MEQYIKDELLNPMHIDGVLKGWSVRASNRSTLSKYLPVERINQWKISYDVDLPTNGGGATPLAARNAEPPLLRVTHGRSNITADAPMFKEMVAIVPEELEGIREIGTFDKLVSAQKLLASKIQVLEQRFVNRLEIMRRQMIFDGEVVAATAEGIEQRWAYTNHPDYMNVEAAVSWDDPAARPQIDLLNWISIWEEESGFRLREIILPHGTLSKLQANDRLSDLTLYNYQDLPGGTDSAKTFLRMNFKGIDIVESSDRINTMTTIVAPAAAGATSVVLREVSGLEVGSKLTLIQPMGPSERVTVTAIVNKTVTFAGTPLQYDYDAGAGARYIQWTIPSDTALLLGGEEYEMDHMGEQTTRYLGGWGKMFAPLYLDKDMMTPVSGLTHMTVDTRGTHNQMISYALQGRFLPVQYDGTGYMKAKILF